MSDRGPSEVGEGQAGKVMAFKIAMREEGEWVICYFASPRMYDTEPIEMGRVRKTVLVASGGRDVFLEIMRNGIKAMMPAGAPPQEWSVQRAPEDEKAGEA